MGTDFLIECAAPLPRDALWRLRGTARFMAALVNQGALARMSAGGAARVRPTGGSASARRRVFQYVPKEMEIPEAVRAVFNDAFVEVTDDCAWDDGVCEADDEHARGEGDFCMARATGRYVGATVGREALRGEEGGPAEAEEGAEGRGDVVANGRRRCYCQNFVITPGVLSEYITTTGDLTLYPDESGDATSCRHVLSGTVSVSIPLLGSYVEQAIVANMETFYGKYPAHLRRVREDLVAEFCGGAASDGDVSAEMLVAAVERLAAAEAEAAAAAKEAVALADGRVDAISAKLECVDVAADVKA